KPLQDRGKLKIRAAVKGSNVEAPVAVALPMRVFELVLHVEQPVPDPRRNDHHGEIGPEDRDDADQSAGKTERQEQYKVQRKDAAARLRAPQLVTPWQSLKDDEIDRRTQPDHHQWTAVE